MKKISRYIFLLVALVLFIGLLPRFLILDKTKDFLAGQLSEKLGIPIQVHKMEWAWLPLPHLSLSNTNIINEYSEISVPKMRIYPNWRVIINKNLMVGSIRLENPEIFLRRKVFQGEKPSEFAIPELKFYIENGRLKVEAGEEQKKILPYDIYTFRNIEGMLKIGQQDTRFDLHGSSSFSRSITLWGNINLINNKYQLFLDSQDIKLHNTAATFFKGHLIPVESTARLAGSVAGTGLENFELNLHGTLPSVKVRHQEREILLIPGYMDLTILKSDSLYRLNINGLEMQEPQVNLSGLIERRSPAGSMALNPPEAGTEPVWKLDLSGKNLDLTAIRHKILTLWSGNKTADTVCGVVLGGRAATGAYRFSGRTSAFENLNAMIIEADVLEADIHVPGAELDLTKAKGPILIKESFLTGHNLSAQLGNSFGSNGDLLLELVGESNAFTLSLDIDADLQDLPPVLEQLVDHDGFQRELDKFNWVSGRAVGNLQLGETLDNILTRVKVEDMHFRTDYDPIPQTIFIDRGTLQVDPEEVRWQKVNGHIGKQEIISTSGKVSWGAEDVLLQIENINARLDGESLYTLLEQTGTMPDKKVKSKLSGIQGIIDIPQGTLKGPAQEPEAWDYQLAAEAKKLSVNSPLLPEPVTIIELHADISGKEVNIRQARINFLDQALSLTGTLYHKVLEDWHGTTVFNGPLRKNLADWLGTKGWLSEKLRPRIPCTMEGFSVSFQGGKTAITGKILSGLSGNKLPMARIDLESTPDYLHIKELSFFAPGEQGRLSIHLLRSAPHRLSLSWEGFISARTIDSLFHHSSFSSGYFSGAFFEFSFSPDQPDATRFKGILKAENLRLKGGSGNQPIIINNIILNGTGEKLKIVSFDTAIGTEKLIGSGHIAAAQKGFSVDINLLSSFITKESLNNLSQSLKATHRGFIEAHVDQDDKLLRPKDWEITGRIGFDFDSFSFNRDITTPDSVTKKFLYTLNDIHGELQLTSDSHVKTEIFSSRLCGLDYTAHWYSDETVGDHYVLATDPDTPLRLEKVIPCLGVEQDVVEGEFTLSANLRKKSGTWHDGNIYIKSTRGRILRLKLLSRIFKIVNITDLFKTQVGQTGKRGFPYSQMDIDTHISDNTIYIDRAILHGEGLNLYLKGDMRIHDFTSDMTLLIAPFKTFDTLVSKVPLIGQPLMSEYESLVAIPVAMRGRWPDPQITPLHPGAVSSALFDFVRDTFKVPYNILKPHSP
ncbi:MAG: AsmA-like C-terminal domain-containing protein [Deltaproteobacteria bacterium]|jgi:hypothetical protein|nr:AsmA-like C-terminal domain-containing protein [Deltaproteobacteria bacterium]